MIRVELLKAKETEQVIPIEGTSGEASSLPSLPQTNLTAMVSESVNMTLGPDKVCLRSYADPMDTSLNGWLLPKDTGSWTLSTGGTERFILGTPKDESGSVLYLSRKSCQEGSGLRMSVSIRPQKGVRAGMPVVPREVTEFNLTSAFRYYISRSIPNKIFCCFAGFNRKGTTSSLE